IIGRLLTSRAAWSLPFRRLPDARRHLPRRFPHEWARPIRVPQRLSHSCRKDGARNVGTPRAGILTMRGLDTRPFAWSKRTITNDERSGRAMQRPLMWIAA